jgi:hypothetical protein
MMRKKKKISNCIYLLKQIESLRKYFPNYKIKIKKQQLIVEGYIQPSPLHQNYKFNLFYEYTKKPYIIILDPKLTDRGDGTPIPHVYPGNKPCLYYPKNHEFTNDMNLSETIIPWLSLWLYFYEIWKVTGEWLGEGVHIDETKNT